MKTTISRYTFVIYLVAWIIIMLIQSVAIGSSSPLTSHFWQTPRGYYSVWLTDLYLILIFYLNYYLLSRRLFGKRAFKPYLIFVALATILGLFLPMILHALFGWGSPADPQGKVGLSTLGGAGTLAVISVGLSLRAVKEWIALADKTKAQEATLRKQEALIREKEAQIAALRMRPETEMPGGAPSIVPPPVPEPNKIIPDALPE